MIRRLFLIGAQRSGSSWLSEALHAHPEVVMARPARPEPKTFLDGTPDPARLALLENAFAAASTRATRVFGEKSTSYIERPEVADHVAAVHTSALYLAVLRDPVERAVSNHRFSVANGLEQRPLGVALDPARPLPATPLGLSVSPFDYLGRSRYVEHLEPWTARVAPDRLLVVLLDDLLAGDGLDRVRRFLDLSTALAGPPAPVNASAAGDDRLPHALRSRLEEHFAPFNARLASLLGRALPWSSAS